MRYLTWIAVLLLAFSAVAVADDGEMLRRNVSKTPELETEHAALTMLELYVPAQTSDGTLLTDGIDYNNVEGNYVETRDYAKPLISFCQDGHVDSIEGIGFSGHGHRDAFAAVSLDDGATWKRTNLSNSGDLSSFDIKVKKKWVPYPGDVVRLFAASDGNKAILVWASRYCQGGSPSYAIDDTQREALATELGLVKADCIDEDPDTPCLYLEDSWGVSGSQGSSDFADEGYPEVGEVPYSCLWAARGTLEPVDAEGNYVPDSDLHAIIWRKAERLTSGRRDAFRMETACVEGAGCVVTWQEDPEGLRPGEGEGPGEGWSGAIAHHKTDIWYSYIAWDNFDLVDNDELYGDPVTFAEFTGDGVPPVGIPMSIPLRLTDNAMCVATDDDPYCYADFDDTGTADFCADTENVAIETPEGPTEVVDLCVAEDGRLMRGNIASTRARINLRGYSSDDDDLIDSAWVIVAYEESKGLGEESYDAGLIDPNDPDEMTKVDMGKNIWYHTFNMFEPELVSQGLMLNQPAIYPEGFQDVGSLVPDSSLGYNFMTIDPDPIYEEQATLTTTLYQTEIARRFSLISQEADEVGLSGTVAFAMWKQGIIRRGGPADVMARRFVIPDGFNPAVDNPFAYENMVCDADGNGTSELAFTDGSNPRYVKGLCPAPAIALSTTTIVACDDGSEADACADAFPWNDYFDDVDMSDSDGLAKVTEWEQTGPIYQGDPAVEPTNLNDPSWENPYDVAKGHRGFIEGDFIMMMYAWSPNWMANTVGHDNYNLYIRRSFDGGLTWTTTPASFVHNDGETYSGDGTVTCEWQGPAGTDNEFPVCTTYGAGDFEQARNVSQLVGTQETILDPRYSPTRSSITDGSVPEGFEGYVEPYDDDARDPSRFFMVYETGDNTTVEFGEAEPLDLYYGRAVDWGDHYLVWQDEDDTSACLPSADPEDDRLVGFCNEFDWLEGSKLSLSGEAGVTANPGGTFFYALWNQEDVDKKGNVIGSDAWFRRVAFIDDYVPPVDGDDDGGGGKPPKPPKPPKP